MDKFDRSSIILLASLFLISIISLVLSSCGAGISHPEIDLTPLYGTPSPPVGTQIVPLIPNIQTTQTQISIETPTSSISSDDPKSGNFSEPTRTTNTPSTPLFTLCSPLEGETVEQLEEIISDPYNPPPPGKDERHQGVDFSYYRRDGRMGIEGVDIYSILPGAVVAKVKNRLPYGNMVIIETPGEYLPLDLRNKLKINDEESLYHLYAHMKEEPIVDLLDDVECGQTIGVVGATGYDIVNAHLHLETRVGPQGMVFDSMVFYDTSATQVEMDRYRRWRTGGEFAHFNPMILFQFFLDYLKVEE